jgi:hypothetical protein
MKEQVSSDQLIAQLQFPVSVPLTFVVHCSPCSCFRRFLPFYPWKMRLEVVSAASGVAVQL